MSKRKFRKSILWFLSFILLFCGVGMQAFDNGVTAEGNKIPNSEVYVANAIMYNLGEGAENISLYNNIQNFQDPLYKQLGGYLLEDKWLTATSAVWQACFNDDLHTNPYAIYEAVIMDYLKYSVNEESDDSIDVTLEKKSSSFSVKVMSEILDAYADAEQDELNSMLNSMTVEQATEFYQKNIKGIEGFGKALSEVSSYASTFVDLTKGICDYLALQEVKQEKIQLLEQAKIVAENMDNPNKDFIIATEKVINYMQSTTLEYMVNESVKIAYDNFLDTVWDAICVECPYLKVITLGADGLNVLFNATDGSENNIKLALLYEVDCYLHLGMMDSANSFKNNPNDPASAELFNACFAAYVEFQMYGNKFANQWIDDVINGGLLTNAFTQIFYQENIEGAAELINYSNGQIKQRNQMLSLVNKYREVYLSIYLDDDWERILNGNSIPVTGISFSKDSMVIDLNPEIMYILDAPTIYPSNASNSNVIYTSSDETIVGTNGYFSFLTPKKEGTVTITATTEDGGYTDSIVVEVCKEISGYCGDNVKWTLNDKGTLNIYGRGRMEDSPWRSSCQMKIKDVVIGKGVTSIDDRAFEGCSNLTSISIPDGVTSIGYQAFYDCSSLNKVTVFETGSEIMTADKGDIGDSVFEGCNKLEYVEVPKGIVSIGNDAFSGCSSITSISIPEGVTSIGNDAFSGCSSITSISIPEGVTSIGDSAFYNCSSLTSISIPEGVTGIEDSVFSGCSSLTSISIPDGVTSIGDYAFNDCSSLTSISIPAGVTSIGDYAFWDCSSLTSISIPDGVTSIGYHAFYDCSSLNKVTVFETGAGIMTADKGDIGNDAFKGCNKLEYVEVPKGIAHIGDSAFYNCSSLTSISIPDGVTSIGYHAFYDCSSLNKVTVFETGAGIMTADKGDIGDSVFEGCNKLEYVEVPKGIAHIGDYAFWDCSSLTSISIPDGVTGIGNDAFGGCSSLTSISIPDGVTNIGYHAFYDCSSLNKVTVFETGAGIMTADKGDIGNDAFEGCNKLEYVEVPKGIASIGASVFRDCGSLSNITIPESVTSIGANAFYCCDSLSSITIPESVTSIGDSAFWGCRGLSSITIPESVTSIGDSVFCWCESLTNITIPESVTSIGANAFSGCDSLTSITIPESVTSIEYGVFSNCRGLSSITIPESVTSIEDYAFSGCSSLSSITIPKSVTSMGNDIFNEDDYGNVTKLVCEYDTYAYIYAINNSIPLLINEFVVKASEDGNQFTIEDFTGNETDLQIPDVINGTKVTSIGYSAFWNCSSLTSISIPEGVTDIGAFAFDSCSNLTSITIPEGVTSIGDMAFAGCSSLTSVTIPKSVTSIGSNTFQDCNYGRGGIKMVCEYDTYAYTYAINNNIPLLINEFCVKASEDGNQFTIEDFIGNETDLQIPDVINATKVTGIGEEAFRDCSSLISISIPEGVTSIEDGAFWDCSRLSSITIPESVASIGKHAFSGCSSLTEITIPESVTDIGDYVFEDCSSLSSITIPESVTRIGVWTFRGCSSLTSITIPESVTCMWYFTFKGCNENMVISCKKNSYAHKYAIEHSIKFKLIDEEADSENNGSSNTGNQEPNTDKNDNANEERPVTVKPAKKGTTIMIKSKSLKVKVTSASIKNPTVTVTGFAGKTTKKAIVPSTIKVSGITYKVTGVSDNAFKGNKKLTTVSVGSNVTKIGKNAFSGCTSLKRVTIGKNVTSIGSKAFYKCTRLKSITIPAKVKSIGSSAFSGCKSLRKISMTAGKLKVISKGAFKGINKKAVITVKGTKKAKAALKKKLRKKTIGYVKTWKVSVI